MEGVWLQDRLECGPGALAGLGLPELYELAEEALAVEKEARLDDAAEEPAQQIEEPPQEERALALATLQNDVDRELLKILQPAAEHGPLYSMAMPPLSACVMTMRAPDWPDAASMASPTASGFSKVTQQMVEPEPERNPPSAPAASPAAMTAGRKEMSDSRNGW